MAGSAWSAEDDTKLNQLAARGLSAVQISQEIGRSTGAVHKRAKRLRINLAKTTFARISSAGENIARLKAKK